MMGDYELPHYKQLTSSAAAPSGKDNSTSLITTLIEYLQCNAKDISGRTNEPRGSPCLTGLKSSSLYAKTAS